MSSPASPSATGPYKFVEQVVGSHIKMTAVDSHWRIGVPKYKNVTFKLVPEETTRIACCAGARWTWPT